jgi:two-component system response regulator ResD
MAPASHLLVVEDDPTVAVWLATLFRRFGFSVGVADNGLLGIRMARERRPDVVVLDYNLPGANGGEVMAALRRERPASELSIVMLSGEAELDVDGLLEAGVDAFLPKHADGLVVLTTVQSVLENRVSAARAQAWAAA